MSDQDLFEARLRAEVRRYAAEVSSDLDPVAFAHTVATTLGPRRARGLAWPWRAASVGGLGWLLILAVLLAVIAGAVGVGAFRRLPAAPFGLARPGLIAVDLGGDIVLTEADGSNPRKVPGGAGQDYLPSWSPDGTKLAFWRATEDHFSIMVMAPDGGVLATIATPVPVPADPSAVWAGGAQGPLDWSPDSRRLAFWMCLDGACLNGNTPQITTVNADGSGLRRIGDASIAALDPAWSPDGRRIAFACINAEPGKAGVYVMNADGTDAHRVSHASGTVFPDARFWAFREPKWQPDGDLIAFHADPDGTDFHVFVVRADGTGERDITVQAGTTGVDDSYPSWSPDGRRLAYTSYEGPAYRMVIVDADGMHPTLPAHPPVASGPLLWSPDGRRVLGYLVDPSVSADTQKGLVDVDVSGTRPARVVPLMGAFQARWQRLAP